MSAGELIITDKLQSMTMILQPNQSEPFGNAGNAVTTIHGPSFWVLSVQTERLNQAQERAWRAWIHRRAGGLSFTAWDLQRYAPAGSIGNPDGSIGLTVDPDNNELGLTSVGSYVAKVGDMISYRTLGSGFYLGEIQADATAVGSNVTVSVLPKPRTAHGTPAVRRVQALGEFKLTTGVDPFGDFIDRRLSFEAREVIR